MIAFLQKVARECRKELLLVHWELAVKKEYPLWFNSRLNPTPPSERFFLKIEAVQEVLDTRRVVGVDPLDIIAHLLKVWPGALLGSNAWYTLHRAREMRMLDENFSPIKGARYVNEEARRMQELRNLGGPAAVQAYCNIMK